MDSIDTSSYDPKKWKDRGNYYLYDTDQRNPDWHLVRIGRPSGSNCGALLGHSNFSTVDETVEEIVGKKKKIFTDIQLENMKHGTDMEPEARDWYASSRGVKVDELGFIVPKFNLSIGVSLDGDVLDTDGIIEIKCPKSMYKPLKYKKSSAKGFNHIWKTHFDQMQLGMAVTGKKWCDYVVYCPLEDEAYVERIPFDNKYWTEFMYPTLISVVDKKIRKHLDGSIFPLCPEVIHFSKEIDELQNLKNFKNLSISKNS